MGGGGGLTLILGSLSIDVREPWTETESRMFLFWRIFAPHNGREKLLSGVCDCDVTNAIASKRSKRKKIDFPVSVRGSRASVLRLCLSSLLSVGEGGGGGG